MIYHTLPSAIHLNVFKRFGSIIFSKASKTDLPELHMARGVQYSLHESL
jgi:hypothetical protein